MIGMMFVFLSDAFHFLQRVNKDKDFSHVILGQILQRMSSLQKCKVEHFDFQSDPEIIKQ